MLDCHRQSLIENRFATLREGAEAPAALSALKNHSQFLAKNKAETNVSAFGMLN